MTPEAHEEDQASERRADERQLVVALAELAASERGDEAMSGLVRDISSSGAQLYVNRHLEVGVRVDVTFRFAIDGVDQLIRRDGEVVRSELLGAGRMGLWLRSIGLRFDEPLAEGEEAIVAALAAAPRKIP
jgi:hypothetical protein